jgi:hypothetical protein
VNKKLNKLSQVVQQASDRQKSRKIFLAKMDRIQKIYAPLATKSAGLSESQLRYHTKQVTYELERQEKLLAKVAAHHARSDGLGKQLADVRQINKVTCLNAIGNANLEKSKGVYGQIMKERVDQNVNIGEIPEVVTKIDDDFRQVLKDNHKICATKNREMANFSSGLKQVSLPTIVKPTGHVKGELSHRGQDSEAYSSKVLSSSEYQPSLSILTHGRSFYGNPFANSADPSSTRGRFGSSLRVNKAGGLPNPKFNQTMEVLRDTNSKNFQVLENDGSWPAARSLPQPSRE